MNFLCTNNKVRIVEHANLESTLLGNESKLYLQNITLGSILGECKITRKSLESILPNSKSTIYSQNIPLESILGELTL